jgi:hypothetical protein
MIYGFARCNFTLFSTLWLKAEGGSLNIQSHDNFSPAFRRWNSSARQTQDLSCAANIHQRWNANLHRSSSSKNNANRNFMLILPPSRCIIHLGGFFTLAVIAVHTCPVPPCPLTLSIENQHVFSIIKSSSHQQSG